jgi:hypothetical protein
MGLGCWGQRGAGLLVLAACVSSQTAREPPIAPPPPPPELSQTEVSQTVVEKPTEPQVMSPLAPAPPPGESDEAEVITSAPVLLVKGAFAQPESVLFDVHADVYLVSNLNGGVSDADDNGFISRVGPDGNVQALKWIDGARDEIELNAPKGMAISGDILYVADLDRIRKFNRHTGAALGAIVVSGATGLNDVSAAADGTLYFTDLGAKADADGESLVPTGQDAVFKLVREQARAVVRGKQLNQPNGILADGNYLWVVTFGSNELYDVKAGTKTKMQKLPGGYLDGIVKANDGRMYVSSLETNQIFVGEPGEEFQVAFDVFGATDIGYDSRRNWLLIPMMQDNTVKIQPL